MFGRISIAGRFRRPNEKVHCVEPATIDDRSYRPSIDGIEPAAGQWEALARELRNRRRKVDLTVEPRLHNVLVGRLDIRQVARL